RGAADAFGRKPDDGRGLRQGRSRLHREEPAAERDQRPARSARGTRGDLHAHTARRFAEGHCHRPDERRLVLDRGARGSRHARGLPRRSVIMARALINVPPKAKRGEILEIKTLISHTMETGFRPDATGKPIPRDIITDFVCKYNDEEIFRAELFPAIGANP